MSEFRMTIIGRARVGKSLLMTRFVKNPMDISMLSMSGADGTKVPTELLLRKDVIATKIEVHKASDSDRVENVPLERLSDSLERLRTDANYRNTVSHILIEATPSDWVSELIEETGISQLAIVDTEGVSGDVNALNMLEWKSNLFVLMFNSANKTEFAKSVNVMKSALAGNNVWHAVSMPENTLISQSDESYRSEIKELEAEAAKIRNEFEEELSSLENKQSLLSLRSGEITRRDTLLAIPNIKTEKNQYQSGRDYADNKLKLFLLQAIRDADRGIELETDLSDTKKMKATCNLLQLLCDTAMSALRTEEIEPFRPSYRESSLQSHLNSEYRLQSDDNKYLLGKQWDMTSHIRTKVYNKINVLEEDKNLPLSLKEQASVVQFFYTNFAYKVVWTNYFVSTRDERERTEQASIILMLHATVINSELKKAAMPIRSILESVMPQNRGWNKNYLKIDDYQSHLYVPIEFASKHYNSTDVFDRFYYAVIKPYTVYAMYYALLDLGLKTVVEVSGAYVN